MREDPSNHSFDSPVNGNPPHGLPFPRNEPTSTGFTAVNGDRQRTASFRPDETALPPINAGSDNDTIVVATQFHSHGWRPGTEGPPEKQPQHQNEVTQENKRKRSHSPAQQTNGEGRESPKRRQLQAGQDSAIDLTSPVKASAISDRQSTVFTPTDRRSEPAPAAPHERGRSPTPRWGHMEPPPKPRPETEASLAESVLKFQQSQQQQEQQAEQARQALAAATATVSADERSTSPRDEDDDQDMQMHDDDQMDNDMFDAKRRKRNFSNRTKTGCHTCRHRKKKCDEAKPFCRNCERGGFPCGGYGPKPAGYKAPGQSRPVVPLQSKVPYEVQPGPTGYWSHPLATHHPHLPHPAHQPHHAHLPHPPQSLPPHPQAPPPYHQHPPQPLAQQHPTPIPQQRPPGPPDTGQNYNHWGPPPPQHEPSRHYTEPPSAGSRPQSSRDSFPRPSWPSQEPQPPQYFPERLPSADFQPYPRSQPFAIDPQLQMPGPPHTPLESWQPGANPGFQPFRQPSGLMGTVNPRETMSTSSSQRVTNHINFIGSQYAEKEKMLRGQPYLHYVDDILLKERQSCHQALVKYNKAADKPESTPAEKAHMFEQILQPQLRIDGAKSRLDGPVGSIRDHTIVEAPFKCDYGYNLHFGKDTVVQNGCYLQDAGGIWLGDRVIIGPNTKIMTMTAMNDCSMRKGSQGSFKAGAIRIEDDVFIGANAIVLPYVIIGKGAVVGAGSVVTRDVKEYTIVAGNPAKHIRRIEGGYNSERHHSDPIQEQEDRTMRMMQDYVASNFTGISPSIGYG